MKQIRRGLFETNSSSVHTLVVVPSEDFDKWKNNEVVYVIDEDKFIDYEDLRAFFYDESKCEYDDCKKCMEKKGGSCQRAEDDDWDIPSIVTLNGYFYDEFMERYVVDYKTKSGDEITIFGYYGHD